MNLKIFLNYIYGSNYFKNINSYKWAIPKSTSPLAGKKIQNREQNFIIWNIYIHNCITSPHSCHPHLGTCRTVTLVFVVPRQRPVPPSYVARFDSVHELFVGVKAQGSQPDLHLGEGMVVVLRQVRTVRKVVENILVEELD
jgi:hypothetical protein